ncbi:MAG: metal-dependent hydrolase [Gammaproteobacteria bacterium]|nr:metal-dependent hydrolase [Gammaproteobacteria bacterium]
MDPLTQAVVGSAVAASLSKRNEVVPFALAGALAGMAPDLDTLIRSASDPLLFLEYHRHFTHSLIFIPIGGAIVGLILALLLRRWWPMQKRRYVFAATAGWATHGLLDACTSYGTQLFWPFTDHRVAWDSISIIDPILTLGALLILVIAITRRSINLSRFAVAFIVSYLALGFVQHQRAIAQAKVIIAERGHFPEQISAKPSFANLLLWKIVYQWEDAFYVDAINIGFNDRWYPGESTPRLDVANTCLTNELTQLNDIERFRWFSKDYIAIDPRDPHYIIDVRYSMLPNEIRPLWGVRIACNQNQQEHVRYEMSRDISPERRQQLIDMLAGRVISAE